MQSRLRAGLSMMAVAGLAVACSDPKLDRMTEVRSLVCTCKDAACVEAALAQMPAKSPRDEQRAQQVAREILACVAQVGARAPEPAGADAGAAEGGEGSGQGAAPKAEASPAVP